MSESEKRSGTKCLFYLRNIATFLVSHIGLVSLVVGYCIVGAFTFEALEADHERKVKVEMVRTRETVTDDLWLITNNMSVLFQDNWTSSVTDRLKKFEGDLIEAMKKKGWDGSEDTNKIQWTFAGALFYSIILITTIGYGHIAPKTQWGKVVTIFYAILGIPLMLLCLANIGDAMAHSFRFLYWKVCCYACTRKPSKKSRLRRARTLRGTPRHHRGSSRPNSLRRSQRHSQRSADSAMSDSAMSRSSYSASDIDSKFYDDTDHEFEMTAAEGFRKDRGSQQSNSRKSAKSTKTTDTGYSSTGQSPKTNDAAHAMESGFFNKYAMEEIEPKPQNEPPTKSSKPVEKNRNEPSGKDRNSAKNRSRNLEEAPEPDPEPVDTKERPHRSGNRYSNRGRLNRLPEEDEEEYEEDDYYYDYDYSEDEDYESHHNKPVPIWLSILLVVGYIFGGAFLFSGWEEWSFLDSAYFCFITLTTIGFGDFVPAQKVKENVEVSIALCSLYLLFGIALLAMSFNLVQEEVINSVKSVAKRLGIIKDDDGDDDD